MKENLYCCRFYNAFTFYFTLLFTIAATIPAAIYQGRRTSPVSSMQFYEDSGIAPYENLEQPSYQLAMHLPFFTALNPRSLEFAIPWYSYKLYECDTSMITLRNYEHSTMNITQEISLGNVTVSYNGIGAWCVDAPRGNNLSFHASRQPYEAFANTTYCYNAMTDLVRIENPNFVQYNITTTAPNVNFREDGVWMCRKLPIWEGHPTFKATIIALFNDYKQPSLEARRSHPQTNRFVLYNYNSALDPDYWTYTGFAIAGGLGLATSMSLAIYFAVRYGCREGFCFVK